MRVVLLAGAASLFVAVAILACSSKTETTVEEDAGSPPPKAPETPPEESSSSSGSSGTSGTSGSYGTPDGSSGSSGTSGTSGTVKDADIGDGNAGTLCQVGDVKESEDNGTPGTANSITLPSGFCGRLGAGDTDHVKFTLNSNCFEAAWGQSTATNITITATVDGTTFALNGNYTCTMGKVYDITVTSTVAQDYRFELKPKN